MALVPIKKLSWCLLDCVTGEATSITKLPFEIGSGEAVDLRLTPEEVYERHCAIAKSGKKHWLVKRTPEAAVNLDGDPFEHAIELAANSDYSLMIGYRLYLLRASTKIAEWLGRIDCAEWIIQNAESGEIWGPVPFDQVRQQIELIGRGIDGMVVAVNGAGKGFFLDDIWNLLPEPAVPEAAAPDEAEMDYEMANGSHSDTDVPDIDEISGEFTCPTCWKHFDRKDILWIARHPSLRGTDPDLGEDVMLRFRADEYDERGHARDPMGVSCGEQACPHCKRRLHPGFLDLENHIFSIVGAPSAGKSYFLTSAIKRLEETLPKNFGIAFQDADAEGNSTVSLMKARLFSDAARADEIYLDKTVPGGEMYEVWERDGRQVRLPKPFTYMVSPFDDSDGIVTEPVNLVFYDNAGEHFEPAERAQVGGGDDELQSTKHLASSAVVFFLFDPTSNSDFRARLADADDPQIKDARFAKLDRQNNILSEMRNRIKRELNIPARDKIDTPIAVLVGKCDIWSSLLGDDPFVNPVGRRQIDLGAVQQNSRVIRDFLMDVTPNIVANCEAISRQVVYFPVSPLGHSPQSFSRNMGEGREPQTFIGPVPGKVKPIQTEVPILWALSKLNPGLVPPVQPEAVT